MFAQWLGWLDTLEEWRERAAEWITDRPFVEALAVTAMSGAVGLAVAVVIVGVAAWIAGAGS